LALCQGATLVGLSTRKNNRAVESADNPLELAWPSDTLALNEKQRPTAKPWAVCSAKETTVVRVPHRRRSDEIRYALAGQVDNASAAQPGNAVDCLQALYTPRCCYTLDDY
jgi:hypothetical protein